MHECINMTTIVGCLEKDPEIKLKHDNKEVATLLVATEAHIKESYVPDDDPRATFKTITAIHNIAIYTARLVKLAKTLKKGDRIMVLGTLKYSKFEDKLGKTRQSVEIIVSGFNTNMIYLGKSSEQVL